MINVDFFKYFGTFYRINEFIRNNNDPEANTPKSNEDEFIYKVKSSYNKLIDFVYKYVFFIAYIIILVIAIIDYNDNITNNTLRLRLIILTAVFIFIMLLSMAGIYFMKDYDEKPPNPTTPKFKQQNTDNSLNGLFDSVMGNFTKFVPSNITDKLPGGLNNIEELIPSAPGFNDIVNNVSKNDIGNTLTGLYNTSTETIKPKLPYNVKYDIGKGSPVDEINTDDITNTLSGLYKTSTEKLAPTVEYNNIDYNIGSDDVPFNNITTVPSAPPMNSLEYTTPKNSIVDKINQTPFMKSFKTASDGLSNIIPNISSAIQKKMNNSV
jgi:hypothetical protein